MWRVTCQRVTCDVRRVTCDVLRATCDVRRVTCDEFYVCVTSVLRLAQEPALPPPLASMLPPSGSAGISFLPAELTTSASVSLTARLELSTFFPSFQLSITVTPSLLVKMTCPSRMLSLKNPSLWSPFAYLEECQVLHHLVWHWCTWTLRAPLSCPPQTRRPDCCRLGIWWSPCRAPVPGCTPPHTRRRPWMWSSRCLPSPLPPSCQWSWPCRRQSADWELYLPHSPVVLVIVEVVDGASPVRPLNRSPFTLLSTIRRSPESPQTSCGLSPLLRTVRRWDHQSWERATDTTTNTAALIMKSSLTSVVKVSSRSCEEYLVGFYHISQDRNLLFVVSWGRTLTRHREL